MIKCSNDGNVSLNVVNSTFKNNVAETLGSTGFWGAMGGVICSPTLNGAVTIDVKDSVFDGNAAISLEKTGAGGGGAIYSYNNADLTFNVTKNATYVGNYVENNGVKSDALGGFARFDESTTAKFNVSEGAKLTIGDGREAYDSIAGSAQSTITKQGLVHWL